MLDGGWDFTVSVAVAVKEDGRQVREMGESTRQLAEAHMETIGRKREEEGRLMTGKGSSVGAVGRTMEWRGGQKAENAPGRTHGKNRTSVGNSWSQPPLHSNSKRQRVGSAGPKQAGGVKAQSTLQDGFWASKYMTRAHPFSKPNPQSEIDVGWKREVHGKGLIQLLGQEMGDNQDRY